MALPRPHLALVQAVRGFGRLPHVGEHPGIAIILFLAVIIISSGVTAGGLTGGIAGAIGFCLTLLPLFAYGAWDRAEISDRKLRRDAAAQLLEDWFSEDPAYHGKSLRIGFRMIQDRGRMVLHAWIDNPPYEPQLPLWLVAALEDIMTGPRRAGVRHRPTGSDLGFILLSPSRKTAHDSLKAHARLAQAREGVAPRT